jgi:hypothetical protein
LHEAGAHRTDDVVEAVDRGVALRAEIELTR